MKRWALLLILLVPAPAAADAQDERIEQLEIDLAIQRHRLALRPEERREWTSYVTFSGYIQPQLTWQFTNAAASPNADVSGVLPAGVSANATTALANGATSNADLFRLRRARLRTDVTPSDYARLTLEIEPLPKGASTPATGTVARTVEGVGTVHFDETRFLEIAMGQFNVPFGGEVLEANAERPFIDSSWASGALFPGDFDIGARAMLALGRLTVMSSLLNGVMLGESAFATLPDLNHGKDFTLRADYDFGDFWDVGASGYVGSGERVDAVGLRAKGYARSAENVEMTLHHAFFARLGTTKVIAAVTLASNMDRGTIYPFALPDLPADLSHDVVSKQELGYVVRIEQDATRWLTLGVRYDAYTPDTSLAGNQRRTVAGVFVTHFTKGLKLMIEYDGAIDQVHPKAGPALDKTVGVVSAVLQARVAP